MDYTIRPARTEDRNSISSFTEATFEWGDYVAASFDEWLEDPEALLVVAADSDDRAIAMSRCSMVSRNEAWLQGARVHPDWRRRGIAGAMARTMTGWAKDQKAQILRLAIEDWNEAAIKQVEHDGFGRRSSWVLASRSVGAASPVPSGNGGRRVSALEQLNRAHSSDSESAFMVWSAGPLAREARGLFAVRWIWRRLVSLDLVNAAKGNALWTARSGWVMASRDEERLEVGWLDTRREDATELMRALVDLAATEGADRLDVTMPGVPWLTQAARQAGCEITPLAVYELVP